MKKVLALILALAMTIGVIPTSFAALTREFETNIYQYVFTNASHNVKNTESKQITNGDYTLDNTINDVSEKWGFVNLLGTTNYAPGTVHIDWKYVANAQNGPTYNPEEDKSVAALTIEIYIPQAGRYEPTFLYSNHSSSPIAEIYLTKKPADASAWTETFAGSAYKEEILALDVNSRIGVVDMNDTSAQTKTFTPITVSEAGNYYLTIIPNGKGSGWSIYDNSYCYTRPQGFKLKRIGDADIVYNLSIEAFEYNKIPRSSSDKTDTVRVLKGITEKTIPDCTQVLITQKEMFNSWNKTLGKEVLFTDTDATGTATQDTDEYFVMNSNKTELWRLNYTTYSTSARINGKEFNMQYNVTAYLDDQGNLNPAAKRPTASFVLYVPTAGKYKVSIINNYSNNSYADQKVLFGLYPSDGITTSNIAQWLDNATYLGRYSCKEVNTDYEQGVIGNTVVDVKEPGEYVIFFDSDEQTAKNTTVQSGSSYNRHWLKLSGIKLIPVTTPTNEEAAKNEIINEDGGNVTATGSASTETTVNAIAAYIDGSDINGDVITVGTAEIGKDCTVTAGNVPGYKFLYWAKALDSKRRIISDKAEYTFKPTSGTNNLMAVYVSDSAETRKKAEFYNGNKQLLESFDDSFTVPELPTMAGHSDVTHWELAGTGDKYYGGETIDTLDGEMLFVARYADPASVTVTVVGGEGSGIYNYGELVTATATKRENGNGYKVFNYWEKGGEIVGFGTTYTFNAYETCSVTAVYKEYQPIAKTLTKIILKNINNNNVMAEYIGLEDAVEKGMIFGGETLETATYRAAMTGTGKQFAVENNVGLSATGYAILSDGSVVYDK